MAITRKDKTVVVYNNCDLGDVIHLSIEANPIYDEIGLNNVKYVEHTITVEAIVSGSQMLDYGDPDSTSIIRGDPCWDKSATGTDPPWDVPGAGGPDYEHGVTDELLTLYRDKLMAPHKSLYVLNSGYGQIVVRPMGPGPSRDPATGTPSIPYDNIDFDRDVEVPLDASIIPFLEANPDVTAQASHSIGAHYDLNFGPKPNILRWEPIGARQACRVIWEVKTYTLECLWNTRTQVDTKAPILSFSFSQEYTMGPNYLLKRSITGKVIVGNNVQPNPISGSHCSTAFKDKIHHNLLAELKKQRLFNFEPPPYFKRTQQQFTENENNTELKFNIVDTEIDSQEALPPYMIECDVEHTGNSSFPFVKWNNVMSGSITLAPKVPYFHAYSMFALLVFHRVKAALKSPGSVKRQVWIKDAKGITRIKTVTVPLERTVIPTDISISEKLFTDSKRYNFSFGWTYTLASTEKFDDSDITYHESTRHWVIASGMFTSPEKQLYSSSPGWIQWKSSLSDLNLESADGRSRVNNADALSRLKDTDDRTKVVVDPCLEFSSVVQQLATNQDFLNSIEYLDKEPPVTVNQPIMPFLRGEFQDDQPSLLGGSNSSVAPPAPPIFEIGEDHANSILQSLNVVTSHVSYENDYYYTKTESIDPRENGTSYNSQEQMQPNYFAAGSEQAYHDGAGEKTKIIRRAPPTITFTLTGDSYRLNGSTPAPRLTKIGGVDVVLKDEKYNDEEITTGSTTSLHRSVWSQEYVALGYPTQGVGLLEGQGTIVYNNRGLLDT